MRVQAAFLYGGGGPGHWEWGKENSEADGHQSGREVGMNVCLPGLPRAATEGQAPTMLTTRPQDAAAAAASAQKTEQEADMESGDKSNGKD